MCSMDALLLKDFSEKSLGRAILLYFFLTVTDERNCSIQFIDRSLDCFFGKKKNNVGKNSQNTSLWILYAIVLVCWVSIHEWARNQLQRNNKWKGAIQRLSKESAP